MLQVTKLKPCNWHNWHLPAGVSPGPAVCARAIVDRVSGLPTASPAATSPARTDARTMLVT